MQSAKDKTKMAKFNPQKFNDKVIVNVMNLNKIILESKYQVKK